VASPRIAQDGEEEREDLRSHRAVRGSYSHFGVGRDNGGEKPTEKEASFKNEKEGSRLNTISESRRNPEQGAEAIREV